MSHVEVNNHVIVEDLAHAHAFTAEPVTVRDPVDVTVDWPSVEECVHDGVLGEDAETRAKDATEG